MAQPNIYRQIDQQTMDCIEKCGDCHDLCVETVNYCLQQGTQQIPVGKSVQTLLDCCEICQVTTNFLLRNSDFYGVIVQACADVCDQCAKLCDQFQGDQQWMACGDMCRDCSQSLRQLAGRPSIRRVA